MNVPIEIVDKIYVGELNDFGIPRIMFVIFGDNYFFYEVRERVISEIVFERIKILFFIFKIIIGTNEFSFNIPDTEEEMNGLERLLCEFSTCV